MANIKSFPNNQDEYVGAEYVMRWLHGRTSGVFGADGNAAVAPALDSMAVTVSDGNGWISNDNADGVVWWIDNESANGSKLQLAVDMADAVLPRIDRVVVSWQTTNYVALPEITILKGAAASTPVAPALTNNNILRQISLAAIRIPAGSTAITADMITDERLDASVCGLVTCGISVDTSVMQAQWAASYAEFMDYLARQQAAWEAYFQNIQNDTVYPIPSVSAIGQPVVVNESGDGYVLSPLTFRFTATIPWDSWFGTDFPKVNTVSVPGILETDAAHVTPIYSDNLETALQEKEAWACVSDAYTSADTISFKCFEEIPPVSLTIQIEVNR